MTTRRGRWACVGLVLALSGLAPAVWAADDSLSSACAAIMRGDYDNGGAEVKRLLDQGGGGDAVRSVDGWLRDFRKLVTDRDDLKQKTFEWNVEQGKKALSDGRVYLALCFAVQAGEYATDADAYRAQPWLADLRAQGIAAARSEESKAKWARSVAFFSRLERLWPDDQELKDQRKRAAIHARLELVYKDREAVKKRIRGVDDDMLMQATRIISEKYYEPPDFRKMAEGGLNELIALCNTKKLHEVFDGVANPDLREHFTAGIEQQRAKVKASKDFGMRDLLAMYRNVKELNRGSIALPDSMLVVEFTEGVVGELDDFTSVVWPADLPDFTKAMMGHFRGVGIQLGKDEGTDRLKVVTPLENSPALEAGIQPGDLIFEVDGVTTKGWTTEKAVTEITGEEGTHVTLTIFRPSTDEKTEYRLTRRQIQLTTARGVKRIEGDPQHWDYMLSPPEAGIAYIRLTGFNQDSQRELSQSLDRAKQQGMRGLVLDLRHNPGGLLDVAVGTVSNFLREGQVVYTQGRAQRKERLDVSGEAPFADLPLVVLVNEGSASASEILSGALQDHNRAVVLGERTFGKGSVQQVIPMARDAQLKLTTALYYLPSGRSPHKKLDAKKWGVDPDWQIKLTPKEFSKVLERENKAFIIHNEKSGAAAAAKTEPKKAEKPAKDAADEDENADEKELLNEQDIAALRADPYAAPDVDPQLETALLQLRVKMAANLPWPRQLAAKSGGR